MDVSNSAGMVLSNAATLTIVPSGLEAEHFVVGAVLPGATVTITNRFVYSGAAMEMTWRVILPSGWAVAGSTGDETALKPTVGTTGLAEWSWMATSPSPHSFRYTLAVPANFGLPVEIAALIGVQTTSGEIPLLAKPDPLILRRFHSADTSADGRISLLELPRVIEVYNTRNGSTRTGAYKVEVTGEDGFAPEPTRANGAVVVLAHFHTADSNHDGKVSLLELTRVIELYNTRTGTTRTGQYRVLDGTEDGFAPSP